MDNRLTLRFSGFFSPSSVQTLAFLSFTDRTISLVSSRFSVHIFLIKRVPILAKSLRPIYRSYRTSILSSVCRRCNCSKMVRINTTPIPTDMINYHIVSNRPVLRKKSYSMCSPSLLSEVKHSIAVFVESILPNMTFINFLPAKIEFFDLLFGHMFHVAYITPSSSR